MAEHDKGGTRVRALKDLPGSIAPPEALWGRIAADLKPVRRSRLPAVPLSGVAAVLVALLLGAFLGRMLPGDHAGVAQGPAQASRAIDALPVRFVSDPHYLQQRAVLLAGLQRQIKSLPPETRQKVLASLAAIHQSMRELQAALGRDPANALLQELLVNACQDEMRVLTAVHEVTQGT